MCTQCRLFKLKSGEHICDMCQRKGDTATASNSNGKRVCISCYKDFKSTNPSATYCNLCDHYQKPCCKKCLRPLVDPSKPECNYC